MTDIAAVLQRAVVDAFEVQGVEASFAPASGPARALLVIPRQPDELQGLPGGGEFVGGVQLFDVPVAEVEEPVGGTLTVAGMSYEVVGARCRDPRRLVWTLDGRELG